jgi:regulator of sirC expression with transglutaminase-like and TPR domain
MQAEDKIKEMQALIRLIDEPDPAVFPDIFHRIRSYGRDIVPFLEHEWESTPDAFVQERIESLMHAINMAAIKEELYNWDKSGARDLLQACLIIARYQYPMLNEEETHLELARIRKDIWLELNENLTALEQVRVFNQVFYQMHGFRGQTQQVYAPGNVFLNRVLQTRKGNPLSVGITYMLLAQSLDMPVFGIDLPNYFLLAYMGSRTDEQQSEQPRQLILFFINSFGGGTVYSYDEVLSFITRAGHKPDSAFFTPASNRNIIRRMLYDLSDAYANSDMPGKRTDIKQLLQLFDS